ncbi:adhesion G protein-coupled receptor E1-like [Tachysurus fulvidraco]|uniref:adhesion G protein-coupled receptor E1-like n=1 Tax=Tachysurus fulvidraco TaxID=1234273 RepID=UPI001FEDB395|nr:adhesion G protein-coupled receptor E1-like [Tachysurus fulvidraco]
MDFPHHFFLHIQQACAVMAGIRWFFFISGFVWMFIETVLIFLLVKNLSKIRSNQRERLSMKWLYMIGYLVPVAVVIVCTLVSSQNSVNEQCWENHDSLKSVRFDIPILFIVTSNMILYIVIIIMMIFTLKRLKNENLQRSNTDDKDLIIRVMIKSLAQFVILGCYWIFVYIPSNDGVLINIFLFLNYQQGIFIFLVHCLLNHEVRQQYRKFVCVCFCFKKLDTTTEVEETHQ